MNLFQLAHREIVHRWKTSLLFALLVGTVTGVLTFFVVNKSGFEREITRNVRDIGSNVVILAANVDQLQYQLDGGYTQETMPEDLVQRIIEHRASLNHLIPMLERKAEITFANRTFTARIVGIAASQAMPGRPKSPMQRAVETEVVQLGSGIASKLGIGRDEQPWVEIAGRSFKVSRVNRSSGTWQDATILMDLDSAQALFDLPNRISRIEAIECTSEQCALTGQSSEAVLEGELAKITDQAQLLRRESMANARSMIRQVSHKNLALLQGVFWALLALAIAMLAGLNSYHRESEIGVLQALGYGHARVAFLFIIRSTILALTGSLIGVISGSAWAYSQSRPMFLATGNKFEIDWAAAALVGILAVCISALATVLPTIWAAGRDPATIIGKDH